MTKSSKVNDLLRKVLYVGGCCSYGAFSLSITISKHFSWVLGDRNILIANALWFNAHLGLGLYLYNRKHLKLASEPWRTLYTVYGTFIFNFSSVLLWATCRPLLPVSPVTRTLFGLVSGCGLICIGKCYLDFIDEDIQCEVDD